MTGGLRWRWRWAVAFFMLVQLAALCSGLPLDTTGSPTVNETEATESPTEEPTTEAPTETPIETTEGPVSSTAASAAEAVIATVAPAETEAAPTFVCTAEQLATLATLSDSNAYLQTTCSAAGGFVEYEFPINGALSYDQMTAMSDSEACKVYFQAVLAVQDAECEVAAVYVRSTAEAILALAFEDDASFPTESEVNAAIAARIAEYTSSSSLSSTSTSLSWTMPSASELQQQLGGELIFSDDQQVVGTAYSGSDNGVDEADEQDSSASPSEASGAGCGARLEPLSSLTTMYVAVVITAALLVWR